MIAMALMCEPALIIADEPTTALDVTIQAQILHLLAELQREFAMGLVLITHDLGIVARIATACVVMYAGEVVETGTAPTCSAAPAHPYTRGLLACIPVPGRTRRGAALGTIPGMVPSLVGAHARLPFRRPLPARHRRLPRKPTSRWRRPPAAAPCAASATREIAAAPVRPAAEALSCSRAAPSAVQSADAAPLLEARNVSRTLPGLGRRVQAEAAAARRWTA